MSRRQQIVAVLAVLLIAASAVTIVAQRRAPVISAETTPEATLAVPVEITAEFTPELTPELTLEPVDVNGVQVIAGRMSFTLPITVANSFEVAQTTADLPGQPDIPPVAHIGFVDYLSDARPEFIHTFTAEAGVRVYNVVDLKEARATDPALLTPPISSPRSSKAETRSRPKPHCRSCRRESTRRCCTPASSTSNCAEARASSTSPRSLNQKPR